MVIKQADALDFINSLPGGWDCIVWDPPYFNKDVRKTFDNTSFQHIPEYRLRMKDEKYLPILKEILEKHINPFCIIDFYFELKFDSNEYFIWYKKNSGPIAGDKIIRNAEYIHLYYYNAFKPQTIKPILKIIKYFRKSGNQFNSNALVKPINLYKDIFNFLGCKYVLDPFAGSYNSVRAANELGIKIDACDKYIKPPINLNSNLDQFYNIKE